MKRVASLAPMQEFSVTCKREGFSIGFVPTMGFFHEGHLSLMREARKENDRVVVSVFVNPLQFGPQEDFDAYPRDIERDCSIAEECGVDIFFMPQWEDMYPPGFSTAIDVERLSDILCGASRDGHFRGVTTVVAKLFNLVQPDRAYFGQKDAQQAVIIRRMVEDLNMPLEVKVLPIVRESDGLAMSSRNQYLSVEQRQQAVVLYEALCTGHDLVKAGEKNTTKVAQAVWEKLQSRGEIVVDYISVVDAESLRAVQTIEKPVLIALAVKIGTTRLIDNIVVVPKNKLTSSTS